MSLEEFAKKIENRISGTSNANNVHQYLESKWYRIEDAYEDATEQFKRNGSANSFENEIITVSYAMSLDYRTAAAS